MGKGKRSGRTSFLQRAYIYIKIYESHHGNNIMLLHHTSDYGHLCSGFLPVEDILQNHRFIIFLVYLTLKTIPHRSPQNSNRHGLPMHEV